MHHDKGADWPSKAWSWTNDVDSVGLTVNARVTISYAPPTRGFPGRYSVRVVVGLFKSYAEWVRTRSPDYLRYPRQQRVRYDDANDTTATTAGEAQAIATQLLMQVGHMGFNAASSVTAPFNKYDNIDFVNLRPTPRRDVSAALYRNPGALEIATAFLPAAALAVGPIARRRAAAGTAPVAVEPDSGTSAIVQVWIPFTVKRGGKHISLPDNEKEWSKALDVLSAPFPFGKRLDVGDGSSIIFSEHDNELLQDLEGAYVLFGDYTSPVPVDGETLRNAVTLAVADSLVASGGKKTAVILPEAEMDTLVVQGKIPLGKKLGVEFMAQVPWLEFQAAATAQPNTRRLRNALLR